MNSFSSWPEKRLATFIIMALLGTSLVPSLCVSAQTTSGTVVGRVFDPSGNPLANVKVTIVSETNGSARATVTDNSGGYSMPYLPVAFYRITASLAGYEDNSVRVGIPLNSITEVRAPDITLRPPAATPRSGPAVSR